jgi:hypothetical protein
VVSVDSRGRSARCAFDCSAWASRREQRQLTHLDVSSARVYTAAEQRQALLVALLGWTLDAFDFFIVIFMLDHVAADFGAQEL